MSGQNAPSVEEIEAAIKSFDWLQPALHGGSPCFHICDDGRFCGRAERWPGHTDKDPGSHAHVSMLDFFHGQMGRLMKENISLKLAMGDGLIACHDKLEAERNKAADLADTLRFYGDSYNYTADAFGESSVGNDRGREARAALTKAGERL